MAASFNILSLILLSTHEISFDIMFVCPYRDNYEVWVRAEEQDVFPPFSDDLGPRVDRKCTTRICNITATFTDTDDGWFNNDFEFCMAVGHTCTRHRRLERIYLTHDAYGRKLIQPLESKNWTLVYPIIKR